MATDHDESLITRARTLAARDWRMLIDGEEVEAISGRTMESIDPSTGQVCGTAPAAGADDVARAVAAAQAAQPGWAALSLAERTRCFERLGRLLEEHLEELALLDAIDSGNPVRSMRRDVAVNSLPYVRGYPAMAQAMRGEVIPSSPDHLHYTTHHPYGVVGRINAFNHPVMFSITRPLAALIMGNTVVMKPAPQAPLSPLAVAKLFGEAFPPGVINVVSGDADCGDAIVTDPDIRRVAFTGSVPVGLKIQRRAAESGVVKHVTLELGGKNAMVVFPDADLDAAVEGAVFGMSLTMSEGQACGSNSRVLVHESLHDAFVERVANRLNEIRVGVAYSESTDMGPVVSKAQYDRIRGYIASGIDQGATAVTGGDRPAGLPEAGYFISPTLFTDVRPDMRIAQEEIFGPVMSVLTWRDVDEMLAIANGVEFGLTGSVWTRDVQTAHNTAAALEAGYVWINDSTQHFFGTPFGGVKNSGLGREESVSELLDYVQTKVVHTRLRGQRGAMVPDETAPAATGTAATRTGPRTDPSSREREQ